MAVSSHQIQDLEYLYASNANVSNFVSVKLSGNQNYHLWKTQMLCLMETHDMCRLLDAEFDRSSSTKIMKQYDSLLKGWIFGSVSQDVLGSVVDLSSAKAVWDRLKSRFEPLSDKDVQPTRSSQQETESEDVKSMDIEAGKDTSSIKAETMTQEEKAERGNLKSELFKAAMDGRLPRVEKILAKNKDAMKWANEIGDTVLHISVRSDYDDVARFLVLSMEEVTDNDILEQKNNDGSTALHVAVTAGYKYAVEILVDKDKNLLNIKDKEDQAPLILALKNMDLKISVYLLKKAVHNGMIKEIISVQNPHHIKLGVDFLVNLISSKQYSAASMMVKNFPKIVTKNDHVLMAMAKTFPSRLGYWETLIYPYSSDIVNQINRQIRGICVIKDLCEFGGIPNRVGVGMNFILMLCHGLIVIFFWVYYLLRFTISMIYWLLWKVATRLVPPINQIEKKAKVWEEAKQVLKSVCDEIEKLEKLSGTHHPYYNGPIIEAACQDAYDVVLEILRRSPGVIGCRDKNGHNMIQLAIIHRSEKIYNLIYHTIGNKISRYRMITDSSKNNMLHLGGRLAPSQRLKGRTGAALQLQRELKWREELKEFVVPAFITEENIFKETPDMVFTREHENLVKEGEKWMKATAESCSITAGLITTIVFAAAITVPGGNNQETGIPMFRKDVAFTIFAISDAISLFTSTTSLLVFLSILTARFAEQDFLVSLPRRLIIGLCTLFLSTTAMIVAFSATLFLVFGDKKPWMLAPICGLACLPIVFFVTLQFPLIVDLFRSTYTPIFGKKK